MILKSLDKMGRKEQIINERKRKLEELKGKKIVFFNASFDYTRIRI